MIPGDCQQAFNRGSRQHDWYDAVLEGISGEDVGEARRNDRTDAEVGQRPGGMLPAGTAAEILPTDQDRRPREAWLVQHALRIGTQDCEGVVAESGTAHRFQVASSDDDIRVDVGAAKRIGSALDMADRSHDLTSSRTSVSRPVTAAAAVIAGESKCVR